jgi:hypothetical protein
MQVIAEVLQEIRQEKAGDHTSQNGNVGIGLPRRNFLVPKISRLLPGSLKCEIATLQ